MGAVSLKEQWIKDSGPLLSSLCSLLQIHRQQCLVVRALSKESDASRAFGSPLEDVVEDEWRSGAHERHALVSRPSPLPLTFQSWLKNPSF